MAGATGGATNNDPTVSSKEDWNSAVTASSAAREGIAASEATGASVGPSNSNVNRARNRSRRRNSLSNPVFPTGKLMSNAAAAAAIAATGTASAATSVRDSQGMRPLNSECRLSLRRFW